MKNNIKRASIKFWKDLLCFQHFMQSFVFALNQCFKPHLNSLSTETKIAEFVNSVDLDEVAHHEPPHLELHFLPSSL